jgi:hypothetical protein
MKRILGLKLSRMFPENVKPFSVQVGLSTALALLLSACINVAPTPTRTPTITPSSTPTQSFPTLAPTRTNTPRPSLTPTLDRSAGLGDILYQTYFERNDGWSIGPGPYGAVSLFEDQLIISVNTTGTSIIADSPAPVLRDFNAELRTVSSICSAVDEYGLVFRRTPEGDHYRFTITCGRGARFSRVEDNIETVLVPVMETYSVVPGPPSKNSLAVRVEGDQFKFFVNEILVFEVKDPVIPAGGIGLIVRSRQGSQVTIAFDDLLVREIAPTIAPSPTAGSP